MKHIIKPGYSVMYMEKWIALDWCIYKLFDLISLCTIIRNPWILWTSNLNLILLLLSCTCIHDAWCLQSKNIFCNQKTFDYYESFCPKIFFIPLWHKSRYNSTSIIDPLIAIERCVPVMRQKLNWKRASISWLWNNHPFFYTTLFWHIFLKRYFPQFVGFLVIFLYYEK